MIRKFAAIAAVVALGATVAFAQGGDPIGARKDSMKKISAANRDLTQMSKGEIPFDLAKAKAAFTAIEQEAGKSKGLFPAGSDKGDTAALPAVWTNTADFAAKFEKTVADAKAAAAATKDEASFKEAVKSVQANCGACHKDYRQPAKK